MKQFLIFPILVLLGLGIMHWAKTEYDISRDLAKNGIVTKGEVVDVLRVSSTKGDTYKSVFEYKDESNNLRRFENNYSSNPATHKMGEVLDIVYNPDKKTARVSFT